MAPRRFRRSVAPLALGLLAAAWWLGPAFAAPSVPAPSRRTALCAGTASSSETESSVSAASLNLAKNLVGSGILSLPAGVAAFASTPAALAPSLLLLVLSALISAYTFYLIGRVCYETKASTFGGAWANSVRGGKWIPQWVCIFECFGGAVVYAMVLGDVFSSLLQGLPFLPPLFARRYVVILATSVAVLFPLCCLRSFAQLAKFSLLGTLATSYVVLFVVKRFFDGSYAAGGVFAHQAPAVAAASQSLVNPQMLVLVALLSTAFLVHFNAPQFFVEMPPAEPSTESEAKEKLGKFAQVSVIGFGIASLQYALVMAFGFLTFGKAVSGNVLLNYDTLDPWAAGARLALGVSTLFGYPMQFAGFREGILEVFNIGTLKKGPHRLATAGLLGVAVGVACVFRDLGQFQAIEGAMLAAFLIFAAGPIMALKLPMGRALGARLRFRSLMVLGVAFMCIGCAVNFGWL